MDESYITLTFHVVTFIIILYNISVFSGQGKEIWFEIEEKYFYATHKGYDI